MNIEYHSFVFGSCRTGRPVCGSGAVPETEDRFTEGDTVAGRETGEFFADLVLWCRWNDNSPIGSEARLPEVRRSRQLV